MRNNEPVAATDWVFHSTQAYSGADSLLDNDFRESDSPIREAIQNSLDAACNDKQPVQVTLELMEWSFDDLPNSSFFQRVINRVIEEHKNEAKLKDWLERAKRCLNHPSLPVLRITDSATTGLAGDYKTNGTAAHAFMNWGVSPGASARGGSFGFGKAALYTISDLRACFYRSLDQKGNLLFFGKTMLPSFTDPSINKGDIMDGRGYWGYKDPNVVGMLPYKFEPITNHSLLPHHWYSNPRIESGLDIYVLGYRYISEGDWYESLLRDTLNNFWGSIHFNKLQVAFIKDRDTRIELDKEQLQGELEKRQSDKEISRTLRYYQAVKDNPRTQQTAGSQFAYWSKKLDKGVGKSSFYLKINTDETTKPLSKVLRMRLPRMKIDEKSLPATVDYAGVFICEDAKGNELLRDLEPLRHDEWNSSHSNSKNARAIIKTVNKFIGDCLDTLQPTTSNKRISLLSNILYYPKGSGADSEGDKHKLSPVNVRAIAIPQQPNYALLKIRTTTDKTLRGNFRLLAYDDNRRRLRLKIRQYIHIDETIDDTQVIALATSGHCADIPGRRSDSQQAGRHSEIEKLVVKPNINYRLLVDIGDPFVSCLALEQINE